MTTPERVPRSSLQFQELDGVTRFRWWEDEDGPVPLDERDNAFKMVEQDFAQGEPITSRRTTVLRDFRRSRDARAPDMNKHQSSASTIVVYKALAPE